MRGSELVAKVGDRMAILSGDDGTAFPLYACGARGVISVVSNVAPRAMSDMWDAVKAGEWDRARQRHYELRVLTSDAVRRAEPRTDQGGALAARPVLARRAAAARLRDGGLVEQLRNEMRAAGML